MPYGIAVDTAGSAWVTGGTYSADFPMFNAVQNTYRGSEEAVVAKLNPQGGLAYSIYLGTPTGDRGFAVAVDPFGNAYVSGHGGPGFPTTAGVYQPSSAGGQDSFVAKFGPNHRQCGLQPNQVVTMTLNFVYGAWPLNYSPKILSGTPSR